MEVALAVVPQCPHRAPAEALLEQALADIGVASPGVRTITISDIEMAERLRFRGSPTFMINGVDVLPSAGPFAVSCRLYQTADRAAGLPSLVDLRQALKRALDTAARFQ